MKKLIYILLLFTASNHFYAQVGIGTNTPDNSAILDIQSGAQGVLFPRMGSTERSGITSPASGLHVYDTDTKSLWYYNGTLWVNSVGSFGDVKSGFQTEDHSGWVLLDGRAVTDLSANQQAVATALGFGSNIPDATDAYLVQKGSGLGAVTGSNTKTIAQNNLPNITLSGSTSEAGQHDHEGMNTSITTSSAGAHSHDGSTIGNNTHAHNVQGYRSGTGTTGIVTDSNSSNITLNDATSNHTHSHTLTIESDGAHTHTVNIADDGKHTHTITTSSMNGGVTQQALNIAPKSLSVNMFVYLGQ